MRTARKVKKPQAYNTEESTENNEEPKELDEEEQILEAFKTFDVDKDGTMSIREFTDMLHTCAPDLTKADIDEIIHESKFDKSGHMNYEDFIQFWKQMSTEQ